MEEIQTNNSSKKIITREPEDNVKEKIENPLVSKNVKISSNSKSVKKENIHNEKPHRSKSKSKSKSKSRPKTKQNASKSAITKELNIDISNNASKITTPFKDKDENEQTPELNAVNKKETNESNNIQETKETHKEETATQQTSSKVKASKSKVSKNKSEIVSSTEGEAIKEEDKENNKNIENVKNSEQIQEPTEEKQLTTETPINQA